MTEQDGVKAKHLLTLLIPVALLYTREKGVHTVRVVKCRIEYEYAKLYTCMPLMKRYYLPYEFEELQIRRVVRREVVGVSLLDLSQHKEIRDRLLTAEDASVQLAGVNTLAYVNSDTGNTMTPGIFCALLSHWSSKLAKRQYVAVLGYWDYCGVWHKGIEDVPETEPYATELRIIKAGAWPYAYYKKRDRAPMPLNARATIATTLPLWQTDTIPCAMMVYPLYTEGDAQANADVSAHALAGTAKGTVNHGMITYRMSQVHGVVRTPTNVHGLFVAGETSITTEAENNAADVPRFVLTDNIHLVGVQANVVPPLLGIERLTLWQYLCLVDNMDRFVLPQLLTSSAYTQKGVLFRVHIGTEVHYLNADLNVHAISRDMYTLDMDIIGQAWRAVTLPTAKNKAVYKGHVVQPQFYIILKPGLTNGYSEDELKRSFEAVLFYVRNDAMMKRANLDFSAVSGWTKYTVSAGVEVASECASDFMNRRNELNLRLGKPNVRSEKPGFPPAVLTYATTCAITDKITAPLIPYMICSIATLVVPKEIEPEHYGDLHIKGNIQKLDVLLNAAYAKISGEESGTYARGIKHIYIDGRVDVLRVMITEPRQGETEADILHGVHIHMRADMRYRLAVKQGTVFNATVKHKSTVVTYSAEVGTNEWTTIFTSSNARMVNTSAVWKLISFDL